MKIVTKVLSIAAGLILVIFGANKIVPFLPPMPMPEDPLAAAFMGGLFGSPYFGLLLGATEVAVGLMLILKKYVPLALVILAPIALNMMLYHVTMDPAGGIPAYLVFAITVFLIIQNKEKFEGLLT